MIHTYNEFLINTTEIVLFAIKWAKEQRLINLHFEFK
jgi:hypothetical protein